MSAAASAVLDRARREADAMGHHYVGTDHLLLSLTAQPGSVAARVLAGIGVTGDHLRPEVARLLDAHPRARRTRDEPTYEQVIGGRRFAVPPAIGAHHRQAERLRDLLHRHGVTVDHPETDQHETAARRSPPAQEHLGT
nr:hypothetical protein GCM10020092_038570 [Actinoplanes digitatis]